MNGPPVSSVIDRVTGCKQAFAKAPGIKVVSDNQNGKGSREGGLEVMIGLLTANDDIDAVFTINDPQAIGADLAAKQLNFTDIIITSVDGAPDIEGALKQPGNLIQASAAQDPFAMAQKAVEVGYEILQGKQPAQSHHPDPGGTDHPRQRRPVQGLDGVEVAGVTPCAGGILPGRRRSFARHAVNRSPDEANMADAISIGELLIDFVPVTTGTDLMTATAFHKAAGGAPANVAVGLARLGVKSALMGKAGEDGFGRFLVKTLTDDGVDVSPLRRSRDTRTPLAFVSLAEDAEREFLFYGDISSGFGR